MSVRTRARLTRSPLTLALAAAMLLPAGAAMAQDAQQSGESTTQSQDTKTLDKVTVTGSRIKKVDVEGAAPITIISAEEIRATGLNTISEVLSTLTVATGDVANDLDTGGWTPNAAFINLRGMGPGYTLVLVNGRRMADYPQAYGGSSNAVSTSSIPSGAVERIEVLSGGASAIYGSDAVAGVINIITKDNYEGDEIRVKLGTTTRGGGNNGTFQWTGGRAGDRWSATYGVDYFKRDPILANQREFMDSYKDNPQFGVNAANSTPVMGVGLYFYTAPPGSGVGYHFLNEAGKFVRAESSGGLDALNYTCGLNPEFETYKSSAAQPNPNRCGYYGQPATQTIQTEYNRLGVFASGVYNFENGMQFYGQFLGTEMHNLTASGTRFIQPSGGTVNTKDFGTVYFVRYLTPAEIGSPQKTEHHETAYNFAGGLRGTFWDDKFDWDVGVAHSRFKYESSFPWLVTDATYKYFWGDRDPVTGKYNTTLDQLKNWMKPITPDQYSQFADTFHNSGDSQSTQFNVTVSGDLFELPAGPLGAAAVVEYGNQQYEQVPDIRTTTTYTGPDKALGLTSARSKGERNRYAAGLELSVPIFSKLKSSLAARWDRVDDMSENAFTWSAGLEFRPFSNLLLRGNYATSYRAPDMSYTFAEESGGYYRDQKDYYRCRLDGLVPTTGTGTTCVGNEYVYQVFGVREGNQDLNAEEGKSFTAGLVWDITDRMSFTTDYYDIELEGKVAFLSTTYLLRTEADCRLGVTESGESVDLNSQACLDFLDIVKRDPVTKKITGYETIRPYNQAKASTSGIDSTWTWRLGGGWMGDWTLKASHTAVLKLENQDYPGSAVVDIRDHLQYFNFRSRASWSVNWNKDSWSTTLSGYRLGSLPNWEETGRIAPFMFWNLSVTKKFSDKFRASVQVVNLFDATHPQDDSYNSYPFFWRSYQQGAVGPQVYLDATYRF